MILDHRKMTFKFFHEIEFATEDEDDYELEPVDLSRKSLKRRITKNRRKIVKLDLSGFHISVLPPSIDQFQDLEELDLSGNYMREVPKELSSLKKLKKLNLSNNDLQEVPAELCSLPELKELDISENQLTQIPPMPYAEILNLRINKLTTAESLNLTEMFPKVRELNLSENDFGSTEIVITPGNYIEELIILAANVTKITGLRHLKRIKSLTYSENPYLQDGNFKELPYLQSLEELVIMGGDLTHFPEEIKQLLNLKHLNISINKIKKIPNWICELKSLERLLVMRCQLEYIAPCLSEMNLKGFTVYGNRNFNDFKL